MIKYNEVTWYSKLGAILFFIGILPTLSFYIGMRYQEAKESNVFDITKIENSDISSSVSNLTEWKTQGVFGYALSRYGQRKLPLAYQFPNQYDNGDEDTVPGNPSNLSHIISIPFHSSSKVLRAYYSKEGELSLFIYDPQDHSQVSLGKIREIKGGNSGGLFVPYAITKDNQKIIYNAYMGAPGAGGGSTDYGFIITSITPTKDSDGYVYFDTNDIPFITRQALFYDDYSKAIYVDEGDNLPIIEKPGPSNDSVIKYKDLISNKDMILQKEKDTSYRLVSIDESKKTLDIEATHYTFSGTCKDTYCAEKTSIKRTVVLP